VGTIKDDQGRDMPRISCNEDSPNQGVTVSLATNNNNVVHLEPTVTIMPESNHGIFSITSLESGTSTIFAVSSGETTQTKTTVYSSSSEPYKLKLFFPSNNTSGGKLTGYVFSLDRNGKPAP